MINLFYHGLEWELITFTLLICNLCFGGLLYVRRADLFQSVKCVLTVHHCVFCWCWMLGTLIGVLGVGVINSGVGCRGH